MNTALPTRKLTTLLLGTILYINFAFAGIETIPSGSFIVNMGVVPQSYANGLKPWGMIWSLIHNYKVPVKWVINQNKIKDGTDFTYNGVDYKGGTFIIPKKYRSFSVDSLISNWQLQGVVGITTTSDFSVDVTYTIKYNPLWTFDFQNGKIAINYLTIAGIPSTAYPMKDPNALNDCDDLFVMPHADPTWGTHQNLLFWNKNNRGWLWYGCHAGSVIESTVNPADSTQQMNFLTTTGLINFANHSNATPPYSYRYPADPEMQFMGTMDAAVINGSEQIYLPKKNGGWRPSTQVAVLDETDPDVPLLSPGEAAVVAYGRAFGDSSKGKVMFQAGHSFDKNNAAAVAAIRAFFNFSYLSVLDKIVTPDISGPVTGTGAGKYYFSATLPSGYDASKYSYHWSSNCGGTFSKEFGATTLFTPSSVATCTNCIITVTITDGCGREYYQTTDFTVCGVPPVALDRTGKTILNPPGTVPQPIGNLTPLAGTDSDGYVVNYILKSLPANGVLYYDHDNNSSTSDVSITSIPAEGLILTSAKMKSLKFDPVNDFGGTTSFQYTVQDNNNLFSLNTATYIIPVNPPPVAQNFVCTPVQSSVDETNVCPFLATDNISVVNYTIVSLPPASQCAVYLYKVLVTAGQVLSPSQASQLTYKPTGTYLGYSEITYTATDNDGAISNLATITLQMVNQPPVPKDISAPLISNPVGAIQFTIPALSAVDADGTIVSYTITNAPASGQGILYYNNNGVYTKVTDNLVLTISQAGSLKFDPVDTFNGIAYFKYTATDNGNLTGNIPATFSIPVKTILPVVTNITNASVYAGSAQVNITSNLTATTADPTKIIATYIIKNLPSSNKGEILYHVTGNTYLPVTNGQELIGNNLRFKPNATYTGNFTFNYIAKDNTGLASPTSATFTIPVTNAAPVTTNITSTVIYDTTTIAKIKAFAGTDADGSIAKFAIVTLPDPLTGVLKLNGTVVTVGQEVAIADTGKLQFSPLLHNDVDAKFKFTAIDDLGLADPSAATYTIPISFVPYKKAPKADVKNNEKLDLKNIARSILPVTGSDTDGVVTSYKITKLNTASQGTLYLQGVPVVQDQIISGNAADQLSFSPSGTFVGTSSFSYVAIDNDSLLSAEASFSIPLINTPPVANDYTLTPIKTNTTVVIPGLSAIDSDGTVASYKILSLPTLGTLQYDSTGAGIWRNATDLKVLTPAQASKIRIIAGSTTGTTSFTFSAKDNLNDISNVATYTLPIDITGINQKPIVYDVVSTPMLINATQTLINPLSGIDADGSIISYVIQTIPPVYHGTIYYDSVGYWSVLRGVLTISPAQAATLKFAPSGIYAGNVTFTFKAIDNNNEYSTSEATYTIPVINIIPAATNITNVSIPSTSGPALLSPLAGTGSISKYIITELPIPSQGILIMDGSLVKLNQEIPSMYAGRLEFAPNSSFSGNAKFKFTAADNFGTTGKTPATFTIPVSNQAPIAEDKVSQVITNFIGTPAQNIPTLSGIDNDGSISSYLIKSLPAGGKLYYNGTLINTIPVGGFSLTPLQASQLSFDPDDNLGGSASFTYTVKDNSNNLSATAATYKILLNTPPVTNNITTNAFYPGQQRTAIPALTGSDDGAIIFYSILTLPNSADGVLYLNNTPVTDLSQVDTLTTTQITQLSFQPLSQFDGALFTYTATDNTGLIDVTPAVYRIPFFVTGGSLPLQLISFNAFKNGTDDILKWSTSQEINSKYFDIEHSNNAITFAKIGTITARGNSATKSDYSYNDKNVSNGIHYYRLKLINIDGSSKYSNVVSLKREGQILKIAKIMPNPFKDKVEIDLVAENNSNTRFDIYNINGKIIKSFEGTTSKGLNHIIINDLSNLTSGIYLLKIKNNEIEVTTKLFKSLK